MKLMNDYIVSDPLIGMNFVSTDHVEFQIQFGTVVATSRYSVTLQSKNGNKWLVERSLLTRDQLVGYIPTMLECE